MLLIKENVGIINSCKRNMQKMILVIIVGFMLFSGVNISKAAIIDEAINYEYGREYTGTINAEGIYANYYKVQVDYKSALTINVTSTGWVPYDSAALDVSLMDTNGNLIIKPVDFYFTYDKIRGIYSSNQYRVVDEGIYYIELSTGLGADIQYSMNLDISKKSSSQDTASDMLVAPGIEANDYELGETYSGTVNASGFSTEKYRIQIPTKTNLCVDITSTGWVPYNSAALEVSIFDLQNNNILVLSDSDYIYDKINGVYSVKKNIIVDAGVYYIELSTGLGADIRYTLNMSSLEETAKNTVFTEKSSHASYKILSIGSGNRTVEYIAPTNESEKIISIPKKVSLNGFTYDVVSIAPNAFKNNKAITTVVIGNNVKTIGSYAFKNCKKLTTVTIGSKATTLGKEVFRDCSKLKKINIKSQKIKLVGRNAFKGINSKATIKVSSSKTIKLLKNKGQGKNVKLSL